MQNNSLICMAAGFSQRGAITLQLACEAPWADLGSSSFAFPDVLSGADTPRLRGPIASLLLENLLLRLTSPRSVFQRH